VVLGFILIAMGVAGLVGLRRIDCVENWRRKAKRDGDEWNAESDRMVQFGARLAKIGIVLSVVGGAAVVWVFRG
jgi:hypothetical protein